LQWGGMEALVALLSGLGVVWLAGVWRYARAPVGAF